ncbi:MAG: hypothetical protein U0269_37795 [Polyangiales bacterium]
MATPKKPAAKTAKKAASKPERAPQFSFPDDSGRVNAALERWQEQERAAGRIISKAEIARRCILRAWDERGSKGEAP